MISMRERVHLVGGNISLESKPGIGTVLRVTVSAGIATDGS
jgi:signal transduction histidine kinase